MEQDEKKLFTLLKNSVNNLKPDSILLSGGVDSSTLAYLGQKTNQNITAITVATCGTESPDVIYAKQVAQALEIKNHIIVEIDQNEIDIIVHKVVIGLANFNVFWVSAAVVLYKGLEAAMQHGLNNVLTGEGSDDLFGTFPVMQHWKGSPEELIAFINIRMKDIDLMTSRMADVVGVSIAIPFHDPEVVKFALGLPLEMRTKVKKDSSKVTKYLLRETFKNVLPRNVIERPQTMAFTGASTLDTIMTKYRDMDVEVYAKKYGINFTNPAECYLFEIFFEAGLYEPATTTPKCLHCKSALRTPDSVHCVSCGTLQYKGEILPF